MNFSFDNNRPIYLQIAEEIEREILGRERMEGERLESVRDLAAKMRVNPNTVQRALSELEAKKLIETERTSGRRVTTNTKKIEKARDKLAKEKVRRFLGEMEKIGFSRAEIIEKIIEK